MIGIPLSGPVLDQIDLSGSDIEQANFSCSSLRDANLSGCLIRNARFQNADLEGADLSKCDLRGADFQRANLKGANFSGAILDGANLRREDLSGSFFSESSLVGCDFSHSLMRNCKVNDSVFDRASFYRASIDGMEGSGIYGWSCHFFEVNFSLSVIFGSSFRCCHFKEVDFSESSFVRTDFCESFMDEVNFSKVKATSCKFNDVNLRKSKFDESYMTNSSFEGARIASVSFEGAQLKSCDIGGVAFSDQELNPFLQHEMVRTGRPSIDVFSLAKTVSSQAIHPLDLNPRPDLMRFMEKSGIPHVVAMYLLDSIRSLQPSEMVNLMKSTFISFGGPDEWFARKLYDDLQYNGVPVFFFPETASFGEKLYSMMRRVNDYDRIVLICSEKSLNRKGVQYELEKVLEREAREGGDSRLIPISLDSFLFDEWKPDRSELKEEVVNRVVADFSDENKYSEQFYRLLSALKRS